MRKVSRLASAAVFDPRQIRPNAPASRGWMLDLLPSCIPSNAAASHGAPASTMGMNGVPRGNGQGPVLGWGSNRVLTALHSIG